MCHCETCPHRNHQIVQLYCHQPESDCDHTVLEVSLQLWPDESMCLYNNNMHTLTNSHSVRQNHLILSNTNTCAASKPLPQHQFYITNKLAIVGSNTSMRDYIITAQLTVNSNTH